MHSHKILGSGDENRVNKGNFYRAKVTIIQFSLLIRCFFLELCPRLNPIAKVTI